MKKIKRYYSKNTKTCMSCGNGHYWCWLATQRVGCASYFTFNDHLNSYQIIAGYGSWFDGDVLLLNNNAIVPRKHPTAIDRLMICLEHVNTPLVCDKCIARFIKKGWLKSESR